MTDDRRLHADHLETLDGMLSDALERAARAGRPFEGVLFHAGRERCYHRDDQPIPFRTTPHFARWVPLRGPEHCVLARPGRKPLVIRVAPKDFWFETAPIAPSWWQENVELVEVDRFAAVRGVIGDASRLAYVGNAPEAAAELGMPEDAVEPEALMAPLDWHRGVKTPHEIRLMRIAAERGATGHRVARKAFESGASERAIHWAFLEATGHLERELPFEDIVALGEKIAILHYQNKRNAGAGTAASFMLDAGAACDGYASDITRTWYREDADPNYRALVDAVDELQRDLVAMVTPGRAYPEIHLEAHRRVAAVLERTGIGKAGADELLDRGVTRVFLPHGVGHHLGLQVHDVGGHQRGPDGGILPPPDEHPSLRNTRTLEPGHVVTIEPGIYFAPVLLDQLRAGPAAALVDWPLVERLAPLGGVRIEDDVLCTEREPEDLTRPLLAGPRGV